MSDPHDREPVDQATIDCWRANYGLDKRTPVEAMRYWADTCAGMAPAGAVAALGIALDDLAALRKDAERYRKLRAGHYGIVLASSILNDTPSGIDAAVDVLPAVGAA